MSLIDNAITSHKHARWIALGFYIAGYVCLMAGLFIKADWSVYLPIATLVLWFVPVMWAASKYAKGD